VAGVAYPRRPALSGMGADAKDIDDDGKPDVFHTALSSETMPVFRNMGNNTFLEVTAGLASRRSASPGPAGPAGS